MKRSVVVLSITLLCFLLPALMFAQSFTQQRAISNAHAVSPQDLVGYVNPLIGTLGQGNTYPGAVTPFGMVQWSPDTDTSPPRKQQFLPQSGYNYNDHIIKGFSLTHISGAGCTVYGDIPFMPSVGPINVSPGTNGPSYDSTFSHTNEQASAGYYSVQLDTPNIKTELTATSRTGFGQFTYPASTTSTMIVNTGGSANGDKATSVLIDSANQQITGSASSGSFCGQANAYTIYFAAQFNAPFTSFGTWKGAKVKAGSTSSKGPVSGAYVTFNTTNNPIVLVKVGISFVSVQNAQANLQTENAGWDFAGAVANATASWNAALNLIQVSGGTTADTQSFYTALYHAMLYPSLFSDSNGQYTGFDNKVYTLAAGHAQYANYSGWDIYRTQIPLLAMLMPAQVSDMMQSLVNDYQQSGCLPKWPVANGNTQVMDGDPADSIIAMAYAFGATNFDTATALQAMLKGATQTCMTNSGYIERPGLAQYLKIGYLAYKGNSGIVGPASATLQYASDDFAISQFAQALGDTSDYTTFLQRAQNWQNIYNPATGFIEPRNADGTFIANYKPTSLIGFQEGDAYQYSWLIPYNLSALFTEMGGNPQVNTRLNTFFTNLNGGPKSPYAYLGNEPSLASPWSYDFSGQPWQTQSVVRRAITQLYTAKPGGMPGNDDLGTMGAWYVWSALGLYPMYDGVSNLVLGSPLFPQITINLSNGNQVQIVGSGASDSTPYVQSLSVNGQASTQLWQPFSTLTSGATLQFTLGSTPNTSWGINLSDAPPSFGVNGSGTPTPTATPTNTPTPTPTSTDTPTPTPTPTDTPTPGP